MPAEEIGLAGHRARARDQLGAPVVDRQLLVARSQGDDGDRPVARRSGGRPHRARLLGACRARPTGPTAPARPGTRARAGPTVPRSSTSSCSTRSRRSTDTEERAAVEPVQRHAGEPPVPDVVRHPVGIADSGPYPLGDGRVLLVRDFDKLSAQPLLVVRRGRRAARTATSPPRWCSTASRSRPPTSARRTPCPRTTSTGSSGSACSPPTRRTGRCGRCRSTGSTSSPPSIRRVQAQHYRNIAAMDRDEMIRCGAYVYFSFLRPFAEVAGVADELDWEVPRDHPRAALRAVLARSTATRSPSTRWPSTTTPLA